MTAETQAVLDTLLAAAPVGFGFVDREFRLLHVNEALAAVNGRPREEHLGQRVADVVPEIWAQVEPVYRHVLETGEPVTNVEVHGPSAADPGRVHHWLVSYYPVRVARDVIGIGIVAVDVTERHEAEARLSASEERFRLLTERSWDVIYRVRMVPDRVVEYVSPAVSTVTGYSPDEFYADSSLLQRLIHPEDHGLILEPGVEHERSRTEADAAVVVRWVRRDGGIRWAELRRVPVYAPDGTLLAIEGSARDVTARVEAQARLQAAERRFRDLLETIDLGALILDSTGRVEFINDFLLSLLGWPRSEVVGADGSTWLSPSLSGRGCGPRSGQPSRPGQGLAFARTASSRTREKSGASSGRAPSNATRVAPSPESRGSHTT